VAQVTNVEVPDIGDFDDIPIIEILVEVGDTVGVEDPLVTLESDKATMDVPSPVAGVVTELRVAVGDRVKEGTLLLTVDEGAEAPANVESDLEVAPAAELPDHVPANGNGSGASAPAAGQPPADAAPPDVPAAQAAGEAGAGEPPYASPMVRRLARELGVDLSAVQGTGRKGRIQMEDVRADGAATGAAPPATAPGGDADSILGFPLAPWPRPDFAKQGPVERVELSRIQKLSAANLHRNWVAIPHVTHHDEADITDLEAFRKQVNAEQATIKDGSGAKVTMVALLLKACAQALKAFPRLNASLDGDHLILKQYYHLGFAADTPNGLVVPVIRDVDQKGLLELAGELTALSAKAREGKLGPREMTGGTFTISSLGGIGGTAFTPIVNAPEVAILGVTRSAMKPVWDGSEFVPRLMVPLSLSYDHRVIDGALAARFVVHLSQTLTDLRRVLL
jgi:pyruvate dehydrogenase E2 component (dihydrolipoamide acetyltransferase)